MSDAETRREQGHARAEGIGRVGPIYYPVARIRRDFNGSVALSHWRMSTTQPRISRFERSEGPDDELVVSVVIPCLNEEENIEQCVRLGARGARAKRGMRGEVIVADNASEDRSAELAAAAGARVIYEPRRGYGSAYLAGFAAARGRYIVMADADLTYDFREIPRFVEHLDQGAELVMGDRMDRIQPGAMPWLHRYVGNPVLTGILNVFFRTGVSDAHCGMRAAAPRRPAAAGPAHDRHGVRVRDGHPGRQGETWTSASSRSSTTRAAARASCRASATAGATCASCSSTARRTCS